MNFQIQNGEIVKKQMYVGDLNGSANMADSNGIIRDWVNVKGNFVQEKADKYTGGAV